MKVNSLYQVGNELVAQAKTRPSPPVKQPVDSAFTLLLGLFFLVLAENCQLKGQDDVEVQIP